MEFIKNLQRWMERNLEKPFVEIEMNRAVHNCETSNNNGKAKHGIKPTKIIPLRATK